MPRARVFKTSIALSIAHGEEHEIDVVLQYEFTPGYAQTRDEPGQPDTVEIIGARISGCVPVEAPTWLMSQIEGDEMLAATLIAEARESDRADADDAAERRHEERRTEANRPFERAAAGLSSPSYNRAA